MANGHKAAGATATRLERQREIDAIRRARAKQEGRCSQCGDPAMPDRTRCKPCADKRKGQHAVPVDLSEIGLLILRRIRFFDWASFEELMGACGVGVYGRNGLSQALRRLVAAGRVERRRLRITVAYERHENSFRITEEGRRVLSRAIERVERELRTVAA